MRGPARLVVVLVIAAAAESAAAAAGRFVPTDPHYIVANVRQAEPDAALRALIARWRADPADEAASVALAEGFLERARRLREPMFVGRAEAVLAAVVSRPSASTTQQRLYAETLQYRHDFTAAEALLGTVLRSAPSDAAAVKSCRY